MCHYCTYATQSYQEWNCIHQTNFTRTRQTKKTLNISHCIWNPGSRYSNAKHISKERNIDILLSFITTKTCLHCFFVRTKHSAPSMLNHQENTRKKKTKKYFCSLFIMLKVITIKNYKTIYYNIIYLARKHHV